MDITSFIFLCLTVVLSAGRNILSKSISGAEFGTGKFFVGQAMIFGCGSIALMLFGGISGAAVNAIASLTLIHALIYGVLLVSAQWCYTVALKDGNTAICSTVYSLGFIFPTMSGAIFWKESLTLINIVGILCVIPVIVISGMKAPEQRSGRQGKSIVPLLIAMLSSGGLGIMQKVQQNSPYPEQKSVFVLLAFIFACAVSAVCSLFVKADNRQPRKEHQNSEESGSSMLLNRRLLYSGGVGVCFGCCNLLNTTLAGRLDSAVFFPVNNISVILLSMILSVILFKEKIRKREAAVLLLGIMSILLLTS